MKVTANTTNGTINVDLDQVWVWVRLERELKLTIIEAQNKMAEGSTHAITYAIWIASESTETYEEWVKTLKNFDVVDDDPKDTEQEASSTT